MISRLLEHLQQLVAIDTSNPPRAITADGPLADYLQRSLSAAGCDLSISDYGEGRINFHACRGKADVLFNVHMDTVPAAAGWTRDPWTLSVTDERAYGLGACDIKGAAAALLTLAESLPGQPLALLFSTDEEGAKGCCVKSFCAENRHAPYRQVVVAEPTACEAVLAHRGYLSVIGEFAGRAGHSSELRALHDNALHRACRWTHAALQVAEDEQAEATAGYAGICFNLGRAEGGVKSNVIADQAELRWSARLRPADDTDAWYARLTGLPGGEAARWQRPFVGPPLPAPDQDPAAAATFAHDHGLNVSAGVDFWTEASLFSAAGVPALVLGPGHIAQAHGSDEWVALAQLQRVLSLYQQIIEGSNHV
ncbi:MAG: acetylornithine deacetylase [Wenzhouxiangellaceae bacterium]